VSSGESSQHGLTGTLVALVSDTRSGLRRNPSRRRSLHQGLPVPRAQHRHITRDLSGEPRMREQDYQRRSGHQPLQPGS